MSHAGHPGGHQGSPGRRAMLRVCPRSGALTQVRRELLPLPHAALSPSVKRKHRFMFGNAQDE